MTRDRSEQITSSLKIKTRGMWACHPGNKYFNKDWNDTEKTCFACGMDCITIDAAHILARVQGGENILDNIHLLCRVCHVESEMLTGKAYWYWLELKGLCYTKGSLQFEGYAKFDLRSNKLALFSLDDLIKSSRMTCPKEGAEYTYNIYNPKTGKSNCPEEDWIESNPLKGVKSQESRWFSRVQEMEL